MAIRLFVKNHAPKTLSTYQHTPPPPLDATDTTKFAVAEATAEMRRMLMSTIGTESEAEAPAETYQQLNRTPVGDELTSDPPSTPSATEVTAEAPQNSIEEKPALKSKRNKNK